jgi:hypothetical protein
MPRKKASGMIADVVSSAEQLRNAIATLRAEIREKARDLALAVVNEPVKRRGRPPKRLGRPRGRPKGRHRARHRGRPPKPKTAAPAQI